MNVGATTCRTPRVHHGGQACRRTVAAFAAAVGTRLFSTPRQKAVAPPTAKPPPISDAPQTSDASSLAAATLFERAARAPILMTLGQHRHRVLAVAGVPKVTVGAGELHGPSSLASHVEWGRQQRRRVVVVLFLTNLDKHRIIDDNIEGRILWAAPAASVQAARGCARSHRKSPRVAPGSGRLVTGSVDYHAPARITSWRAVCTFSGRASISMSSQLKGREGNCDSC
jgi:hypothetical protein